jgi:arginine decarboxylase
MFKKLPPYLHYRNGALFYEDLNLLELMNTYGSPLEVAYTDMINQKVNHLKDLFSAAIKRHAYRSNYYFAYATKANYYSEVVSTALNHVDFLETSSGYDLDLIETLFINKLIPVGYTVICNGFKKGYYFEKIIKLKKRGLNIIPVIENADEAELFLNQDISFEVGMRINIDEQSVKTFLSGKRSGSAIDTRFGLYFDDMQTYAKKINASSHLKFCLFHFHLGGTIYDIGKYITFLKYLFEKNYCELKQFCPDLRYFDIGGGFPTQYSLDFHFDYKKLANEIVVNLKKIADKHKLPHPDIIGEHGRYTVADHSFFLYEIGVVKKSNHGSYWYLINSSLMNFLPDSWALGQDFVVLPLNLIKNKRVKVKLGGVTCDPDDVYYKQEKKNYLHLPEIKPGQKLYIGIFGVGAYQEMIAGVGGVHHCMIPEGNELIVVKKGRKLHFNNFTKAQTAKELLKTLNYDDRHNLKQYKD